MQKIFFLIFSLFFSYSYAAIENFEPNSHFWIYFIIIGGFLSAAAYFFAKSKFLSQDKQIGLIFLVLAISFIISYFLDSDYKKTQIEQYKLLQLKKVNETSQISNTKINIERRILKNKIKQLEQENQKLKLLENNSKTINSKENIRLATSIRAKINRLENDLLLLDTKINKINKGDYDISDDDLDIDDSLIEENIDKKLSVIEKIKARREKAKKFSLEGKDINSVLEQEIANKKTPKIKIITSSGSTNSKKTKTKKSKQEEFFINHYNFLKNKKIKQAYEESAKKVSFKDYYNWYKNIGDIKINNIKKTGKNTYLINLDITDSGIITNYIVKKEIEEKDGKFKIIKSQTISSKKIGKAKQKKEININNYKISQNDFKKLIFNKYYIVLDVRENLENKVGNIKNSIHIRLADLMQLSYEKLDKKKTILVYDWDEKKARDAVKFLISKGFKAKFLQGGLKNFNISKNIFSGTKNFFEKYNKSNYKKYFSLKELENFLNLKGVYLVDVREKKDFDAKKISGSANVPLTYLPKTKWDFYINKIPEKSKIITICDSPETCFYASVVGIEMEKRLYKFLGIYKIK